MEAQVAYASHKNNVVPRMGKIRESSIMEIEMDEMGIIRNCNGTCEQMVGFRRDELVSHPISMLIHRLSEYPLILNHDLNPVLDYLCHCGMLFQIENKAGDAFLSQIRFVYLRHFKVPRVRLLASPTAQGYSGPPVLS